MDGLSELGLRDIHRKPGRQLLRELAQFEHPMLVRVGVFGLLRQFDHIHWFGEAEQLEHLLLAVAGRLRHDQVGPIEEGILAGDVVAEGGLDERAEVGGQMLFGCRDGFG